MSVVPGAPTAAAPAAPPSLPQEESSPQALLDAAMTLPGIEARDVERTAADCETFPAGSQDAYGEREVCGMAVRFRFSGYEGAEGAERLKEMLQARGDRILYAAEDAVAATRRLSKGLFLWSRWEPRAEDSQAVLVLQTVLEPDRELVFPMDRDGRSEVTFYIEHPGDRLMRLDVTAPEADFSLEGSYRHQTGELTRTVSTQVDCYRVHGPLHEIGRVPQYAGPVKWTLHLYDGAEQVQVRVRWSSGPPLEPIQAGDALGGIRLRNVPYGRASVLPEFDDSIDHPAFREGALAGDRTPLGDSIFWLPPGYWTLLVKPESRDEDLEGFTQMECHLVPVQPGRITVVDWPPSLARAFAGGEAGRVEILNVAADSQTGTVDMALLDADRLGIEASPDNVRIYESGAEAPILSVERLKTPLDVLLLLDSSGSMKHQMSQALASAAHFIRGLPPDTRITVVDFDTRPKKIQADGRDQLLKALEKIRAGGATALYDSILLGLGELQGKNRPALVVFTDGVDANLNDTGPGSKATKDQVLEAVQSAGIPVFTIGLGEKSDVDTLRRLAALSGGAYYAASTPEDLDPIFEQIQKNLGNCYRVRFQRPARPRKGSVPVVSLVVDNSGSMDSDPQQPGCGYRIERVRQTLRRFVEDLPGDFLIQLLTFSDDVGVRQVLARERAPLARALSLLKGEGGTNTLAAVRAALDSLRAVPSSRRYLVFLTDAALEVEEDQKKEFETLLGVIRDAQIHSLWLGMVEGEEEEVFARAARLSGGRHVIATDLDRVARVFEDLAKEMASEPQGPSAGTVRVEVRYHDAAGRNATLVASKDVTFPPAREADVEANPEAVTWKLGPRLQPCDPEVARNISGSDKLGYEVLVTKRIPLDYTAENQAVRMRFDEAVFLSRLRGIDAPDGYRFLALTVHMENILPPQKVAVLPDGSHHPASWVGGDSKPVRYEERVPTYLIPDLKRHCFLRWNNERSYPVSEVTWLLENPLTLPGQSALAVEPNRPVQGALAFLVPDGGAQAASLRFYDTNYGHIAAPLWGVTPPDEPVPLEVLPEEPPTRLSDTFSFRVTGYRDAERIETVDAGEGAVFRILEGEWTSRVQAHLRLDPAERIRLLVQDAKGSRLFRLHPVTAKLPLGYYHPTLFTAGSRNRVALAFRLPRRLAEDARPMALLFDLAGGSVTVPAAGPWQAPDPGSPAAASNEEVEVFIHQAVRVRGVPQMGEQVVAVDASFRVPFGKGHLRLGELVVLKGTGFDAEKARQEMARVTQVRKMPVPEAHRGLSTFAQTYLPPRMGELPDTLLPESAEDFLPLALDSESILPAGQVRRGWILFSLPEDSDVENWRVGPLIFQDLSLPISDETVEEPLLQFTRLELPHEGNESFWVQVAKKVEELSARRAAAGWKKPGAVPLRVADPDRRTETGPRLDPPGLTYAGARSLAELSDLESLRRAAATLRWLPGGKPWAVRYAPEAVLTQGWGTEADLAALAERVLSRTGVRTQRVVVTLLDKGREELARRAGLEQVELEQLPAVRFRTADNREVVLVSPFLEDLKALEGRVGYRVEPVEESPEVTADLTVGLLVMPAQADRDEQMRRMSDILAGGEGDEVEEAVLLSTSLNLSDLSLDCIDIGFTQVPARGTVVYKAVLDGPMGRRITSDDAGLDATRVNVLGWFFEIETSEQHHRRRFFLPPETDITGVFLTLGINLPDLPPAARDTLDAARREMRKAALVPPDAFSGLRWYAHGIMARFLGAQSAWEEEAARRLQLTAGRTSRPRCLAVIVTKDNGGGSLRAQLDLLDPFVQVHRSPDPLAERAFRILGGLAAAAFETAALGPESAGLWEIWRSAPPETRLLFVDDENRDAFLEQLRGRSYPERLVKYLAETDRVLLFPSAPGVVNGKVRWAWLEVDPETYDVRAVLDDETGGALVESLIGNLYEQATSYLVGAFVGITTSLWSVSAFSLELDDYRQILQEAENFARNLAKNFSVGNDYAGLPVGGLPSGSVSLDRAVTFSLDPNGVSFSNNLLGFGNGYQDGISYYFQNAK
jgi:hypothetical protein